MQDYFEQYLQDYFEHFFARNNKNLNERYTAEEKRFCFSSAVVKILFYT